MWMSFYFISVKVYCIWVNEVNVAPPVQSTGVVTTLSSIKTYMNPIFQEILDPPTKIKYFQTFASQVDSFFFVILLRAFYCDPKFLNPGT